VAAGSVGGGARGCLLEIVDVQILSQGDCLAKNLTILRIPQYLASLNFIRSVMSSKQKCYVCMYVHMFKAYICMYICLKRRCVLWS
jgi:hypothetical protein